MNIFSQLVRARLEQVASDIAENVKGLIWYNTTSNRVKVSDGSSVKELVDLDSVQTLTNKTLSKASVGLAEVDNTSDVTKFISPALTGTPTAPTAASTTNTTQIATTAFVKASALTAPSPHQLLSNTVDWSLGNIFTRSTASNITLSFSNVAEGKTISVVLTNSSASTIYVTLPSVHKDATLPLDIESNKTNIYTFIRANGVTYAAGVTKLGL